MITSELIKNFLEGRCSPEDGEQVKQYFQDHPEEVDRFLEKKEWDRADGQGELDGGLREIMLCEIRKEAYSPKRRLLPRFRWKTAGWAAAASIILVVGSWLAFRPRHADTRSDLAGKWARSAPAAQGHWTTRSNPAGREMKITLPDGSDVLLAANSTLTYPENFTGPKRESYLNGEAFFNVTKHKNWPFQVHSGALNTTVFGTTFRITAYHNGKNEIRIRLFTGKIVVGAEDKKPVGWKGDVALSPGDQLQYETVQAHLSVSRFQEEEEHIAGSVKKGADVQGELVFENAAFSEVMSRLSKKYGVNIGYNQSETSDIYFSGIVSKMDSLPIVLKMISKMNGLEVLKKKDGYFVRKSIK